MLKLFLGVVVGYIAHDAVQPTAVGKVLDKLSLPSDLIVSPTDAERVLLKEVNNAQSFVQRIQISP